MDAKDIALIKAMGKSTSSGDIESRAINLVDYGVDVYKMFFTGVEQYTIEDKELRKGLWDKIQVIYEQGNIPVLIISTEDSKNYYAEIQGMTIQDSVGVIWINTTLYASTDTTWIGAAIGLGFIGTVFVKKIL